MMAEPTSPGRGLAVYQPATDVLVGTCSVPCNVRPSLIRDVRTAMAGITRVTGQPGQADRAAGDHSEPGQQYGPGQRAAYQPEPAAMAGPLRELPGFRGRPVLPGFGVSRN